MFKVNLGREPGIPKGEILIFLNYRGFHEKGTRRYLCPQG